MTNETQALVPRPTSLPAAIERRTQITNRLLGELTRRDTEGFFRRHPEFFRWVASRYYPLDEALLDRYVDVSNWQQLSRNAALPWSAALLDRYADRWAWGKFGLSGNAALPWSAALLDRYADRWNWESLSGNEGLPWSAALLDRYTDRWEWWLLSMNAGLPWSAALLDHYADRWDWKRLSANAGLPWSAALLDRYADRWDWEGDERFSGLSGNAALPWCAALLDRYADRWAWGEYGLSRNEALPWSAALLDRYADRWDWKRLSWNEALPWSAALLDRYADRRDWWWLSANAGLPWNVALLDRYADRWDWRELSANAGPPWSEALLDRYADRWDWWWLSWNEVLPWSHALYARFTDRWDIAAVASHYDGNVCSLTPEQVDRLMHPLADAWVFLGLPADAWVSIPGGEFLMGSPESEEGRRGGERQHRVRVAAFQMLKTPVTFAMFDAFCAATGRKPPKDYIGVGRRADRPVIRVSYWDAVDYADWLSERTGQICRLPTEAEWEYACRAGTTTPFWTGATLTTEQANYDGESAYGSGPKGVFRRQTTPVRLFPPNPWGLHDMHGNVWEWCASAYDAGYMGQGRERHHASRDRANDGPRSMRGGCWADPPAWVRSAARLRSAPSDRSNLTGFRLARSLPVVRGAVPQPAPTPPPVAAPVIEAPSASPPTALQPLKVFHDRLRDGSTGPAMIVIPAGEFWMGSPESEPERKSNERRHRVVIARLFAIGRYAVTFAEYDRFCAATGRERPGDKGWGRDRRPVIAVNWYDALDYTAWLSEQTGRTYRLPTEAEWEYACRAGTTTPFWWGESITPDQAHYNGEHTYGPQGRSGVWRKQTVPVDQFQPNPWGLYQVHGNVWEWTGSVYHAAYGGAEQRCIGRAEGGPRSLRGGSWYGRPARVRSAFRSWITPSARIYSAGFRLARSL